jgi:hypothetical protein
MSGSDAGGPAPSIAAAGIVVVDSSPVRNFVRAGAQRAFVDFLGERARLTVDVHRELEDAAVSSPGLRMLLRDWPPHEPVALPDDLMQKAADILGFVAEDPHPSLQDLGEVTCVLLAQRLRDSGQCADPVLLLDDVRHGKNLAAPRRLTVVDTPALIIEMVCAGAIPETLGSKVWRATFSDRSKWAAFDIRLKRGR